MKINEINSQWELFKLEMKINFHCLCRQIFNIRKATFFCEKGEKLSFFLAYFGVNLCCPHFFLQNPERNVLEPNGPYIITRQTKIRNVCLLSGRKNCLKKNNHKNTHILDVTASYG